MKGFKQTLKGGRADKKSPSDFSKKSLRKGQKVEREHTTDKALATEIAMDHLKEDPKYYDKLEVMEKSAFCAGLRRHIL